MRTIDLDENDYSLDELLALAKSEGVLIHSASGDDFLLESADDFDREVAALARNEEFMSFLNSRSEETGDLPFRTARDARSS